MIDPNLTPEQLKESELFAAKRAARGKAPKIEKGEKTAIERDNKILGGLVENILGQINYTEMLLGEKMFLDFSAKLRDGRTLHMKIDIANLQVPDALIKEELENKELNSQAEDEEE